MGQTGTYINRNEAAAAAGRRIRGLVRSGKHDAVRHDKGADHGVPVQEAIRSQFNEAALRIQLKQTAEDLEIVQDMILGAVDTITTARQAIKDTLSIQV